MKISSTLIVNFVLILFFISCVGNGSSIDTASSKEANINKHSKASNMFEWLPTSCAPENFPIQVLSATLFSNENASTRIPQELYLRSRWIEEGSVELMNDEVKPIPDKLTYKWLSFRERKVYLYDGEMPTSIIAKYFQDGFISPIDNKKATYKYIVFALAPTGKICIYLSGKGIYKEVSTLQAKEYKLEGEELNELVSIRHTLDNYIDLRLKRDFKPSEYEPVDANSFEVTKWTDVYKQKFIWQLNPIINKKIRSLFLENYNGEKLYWNNLIEFNLIKNQPVPSKMEIAWSEAEGDETTFSIINFDEGEIFKAFATLNLPNDEIIIQPEINSITYGIDVYIKNSKHAIQLKKCKFETR